MCTTFIYWGTDHFFALQLFLTHHVHFFWHSYAVINATTYYIDVYDKQ